MEQDYNMKHWAEPCRKVDCRKSSCKCGIEKVFIPAALGDDKEVSPVAPKNGAYCNAIVVYEANNHVYIYSSEGVPTLVNTEGGDYEEIIEQIERNLSAEVSNRKAADNVLQAEIDAIKNSPDVVDIVDTYADLQAYDTSHLGDKDIIRVLTDETHDGASSYYRWDKQTETWTYIGSIQTAANTIFYADLSETGNTRHIYKNSDMTGTVSVQELLDANEDGQVVLRMSSAQTPENFNDAYLQNTYVGVSDYQFLFLDNRNYYEYDATTTAGTTYYYSKSTIQLELTAGNNITITGNTISATDTTYSNFVGTDGTAAGTAGLVPAPATTDAGKFLKADGTWDTAGGGGGGDTVYSDKTTSNTSTGGAVYIGNLDSSQAEQTDPTSTDNHYKYFWALPYSNSAIPGDGSINIMGKPYSTRSNNVVIGKDARAENAAIAIGTEAQVNSNGVAIGYRANSAQGEGFNNYTQPIAIGYNAEARNYGVALGSSAKARGDHSIAIGNEAQCYQVNSIALGKGAYPSRQGEVYIGCDNTTAFNNTIYRVIGGVHDGQDAHDAATVAQGNTLATAAPDTSTVGVLGQLWTDTTNMHTYQCTAISGSTYTWTQRW